MALLNFGAVKLRIMFIEHVVAHIVNVCVFRYLIKKLPYPLHCVQFTHTPTHLMV